MTSKKNQENIGTLRNTIKTSKKVAAFVGAGTSRVLGIKTWRDVLSEMAEAFEVDFDVIDQIKRHGYSKTASIIFNTKNDLDFYLNFLSSQFVPTSGTHYSVHFKILNTFKVVLTTNYDTSFESVHADINRALEMRGVQRESLGIQKLPNFRVTDIHMNPTTIVYLHGNNDDRVFIFREEEYMNYYPSIYNSGNMNSPLESFIRDICREFTLVFIGFSFDDQDFVSFYKRVLKEEFISEKEIFLKLYNKEHPVSELPKHYAVISEEDIKETVSKTEIYNALGNNNNAFQRIFENWDSEKELVFSKNAEIVINGLELLPNQKEEIIEKFSKHKRNGERLELFRDLGIKLITFRGSDYNHIENILIQLQQDLSVGNLEEAASAK
ncbi:MAG: SIR2 family protein [Thermodesulfobacteriota bacterium]